MASTEFATGSSLAVTRYSDQLAREVFEKTFFRRFCGTTGNQPIQVYNDLEKGAGDTIRHALRVADRSDGVSGDDQLSEFEAAMVFYYQDLVVNQLRQAHEFRGMAQQRTVIELRKEARESLSSWWAWCLDSMMFAYLSGYVGTVAENAECITGITNGTTGHAGNAITAPDAAHLEVSGAIMTLDDIDKLVEIAKTVNPRVVPCNVDGKKYYVLVIHPYSMFNLRNQLSGAGSGVINSMYDIQLAAGDKGLKNPLFSGASFVHNGVIVHESEFIPRAATATYNVLLGANAGAFAMGNAYPKARRSGSLKGSFFSWNERDDDYGNIMGVSAGAIFGMQAKIFNSKRLGTITLDTQCIAHQT
jgi:N4-gp56 family major capsid protein